MGRFEHVECLNMWRLSSANPSSSYQCDQCKYRYSFQRALYATVLRSSLVLHVLTLTCFVISLFVFGCIVKGIDSAFFDKHLSAPSLEHPRVQQFISKTNSSARWVQEQVEMVTTTSIFNVELI